MNGGAWWATVHGVTKSWTRLSNFTFTFRVSRRKEIIKIRAEINEKETKETIAKINKTKSRFFEKINRQTISQTHQEKKGEESNQQN